MPYPPAHPLFPYTTLFRSRDSSGSPCRCTRPYASASAWRSWSARRILQAISVSTACMPRSTRSICCNYLHPPRSEEHTSELQSHHDLVCRLLLEKKNKSAH